MLRKTIVREVVMRPTVKPRKIEDWESSLIGTPHKTTKLARGLRLIRQQQQVRSSNSAHPRYDYRHYLYCESMGGISE